MALGTSIFISATSSDLRSARDVVAKVLLMMGYTPVWQDIASTDAGQLLDILRARMKPCAAVIQLVSTRYGAEPRQPDPKFGRVSYTQYEALYAESIGVPVRYVLLREDFPGDPCAPESPDLAQLQMTYRAGLEQRGVFPPPVSSEIEVENHILLIRDDLAAIRNKMERGWRRMQIGAVVGLALLAAIGWGVWRLRAGSTQQSQQIADIAQSQTKQTSSISTLSQTTQQQGAEEAHIDAGVQQVLSLPATARADRLADSLATANAADLELLAKAGTSTQQIQTALGRNVPDSKTTVCRSFFDNSRNNPGAITWLKEVLKAGLDPNFLIPDSYWSFRPLLTNALQAGNAPAALALLDAGASPHQFQDIWRKEYQAPGFLFPYDGLLNNDRLTAAEKNQLAAAFRDHGAAYFQSPVPPKQADVTFDYYSHYALFDKADDGLGLALDFTPALGDQPNSWPLQVLKAQGKTDWIDFITSMPRQVKSPGDEGNDPPVWSFEIRYFLGIYDNHAYFMATANDNRRYLIEFERDQVHGQLFAYTGPQMGKGFAIGPDGSEEKDTYSNFWTEWDLLYLPGSKELVLDDYYHLPVTSFQNGK